MNNVMGNVATAMPKYKCHKEVWALKIKEVRAPSESDGHYMITPEESRYAPFMVSEEYIRKHAPKVGGYFVVYEDGYKSFSPAEAFELGYELIK